MDNASYHSRRLARLPTCAWRKAEIVDWLESKNIDHNPNMIKRQLLEIARLHKSAYNKYVVDEMARERGITVLRLPPYHCELNPIELIWAQLKGYVARHNTTFKLNDVKVLLQEAVESITANSWTKCIEHVLKEEQKMWDLDVHIDNTIEPIIITLGADSGSESESDSDNDTASDDK